MINKKKLNLSTIIIISFVIVLQSCSVIGHSKKNNSHTSHYSNAKLPRLNYSPVMISKNKFIVRTTAYTHTESDHIKYGRKNAIGTNLKYGRIRSAAADWSVFPVGTEFTVKGIPNTKFVIDDYGKALVGTGTIDLYKPNKWVMNKWGAKKVVIEIKKWGNYNDCYRYLKGRTKYSHIRQMLKSMKKRSSYVHAKIGKIRSYNIN